MHTCMQTVAASPCSSLLHTRGHRHGTLLHRIAPHRCTAHCPPPAAAAGDRAAARRPAAAVGVQPQRRHRESHRRAARARAEPAAPQPRRPAVDAPLPQDLRKPVCRRRARRAAVVTAPWKRTGRPGAWPGNDAPLRASTARRTRRSPSLTNPCEGTLACGAGKV